MMSTCRVMDVWELSGAESTNYPCESPTNHLTSCPAKYEVNTLTFLLVSNLSQDMQCVIYLCVFYVWDLSI